jgi:hypothetical protein
VIHEFLLEVRVAMMLGRDDWTEASVCPRLQTAIRYLNVTATGRQWIANLYRLVFRAERHLTLSGLPPQAASGPTEC